MTPEEKKEFIEMITSSITTTMKGGGKTVLDAGMGISLALALTVGGYIVRVETALSNIDNNYTHHVTAPGLHHHAISNINEQLKSYVNRDELMLRLDAIDDRLINIEENLQ